MSKAELPIIFKPDMVKAILDGSKTQTRRVVKTAMVRLRNQIHGDFPFHGTYAKDGIYKATMNPHGAVSIYPTEVSDHTTCDMLGLKPNEFTWVSPYGEVGDRMWVREAFVPLDDVRTNDPGGYALQSGCFYRADYPTGLRHDDEPAGNVKWKPSIHMPRSLSRINLVITAVRLERLQAITVEDALAEGVQPLFNHNDIHNPRYRHELDMKPMPYRNYLWHGNFGISGEGNKQSDNWEYQFSSYKSARDSFSSLWHLINDKRGYGWDKNPWVWVIHMKGGSSRTPLTPSPKDIPTYSL